MTKHRGKHNRLWRRLGEAILDLLLLNGLIAKLSHLIGLHGQLSVTHYEIESMAQSEEAQLPRSLKIAFLTDLHAGSTTDSTFFEQAFSAIAQAKPDLLLLGGDFISCKAKYISQIMPHLSACEAPLGKFAVFGNHDLWTDDAYLRDRLHEAGVQVLINRQVRLPAPFEMVSVCGIDDPWTGEADAALAFKDAQAIRLLLMHAPDGLLLLGEEKFDFAFAGHTHGGQVALKDGTPILLPHGPLSREYHYGFFDVVGNGKLIVSRGLGCSNLPVRINADPELVLCTLQNGANRLDLHRTNSEENNDK